MKITNVTPLLLGTTWRNLAYFKVETDEGLVGYGDARALNKTQALLGYMAEAVIAAHPGQALRFNLFQENWHKRDMREGAE